MGPPKSPKTVGLQSCDYRNEGADARFFLCDLRLRYLNCMTTPYHASVETGHRTDDLAFLGWDLI